MPKISRWWSAVKILSQQSMADINITLHQTLKYDIWDENILRTKNKARAIVKTGRFDNKDSAVITSRVSKAGQNSYENHVQGNRGASINANKDLYDLA